MDACAGPFATAARGPGDTSNWRPSSSSAASSNTSSRPTTTGSAALAGCTPPGAPSSNGCARCLKPHRYSRPPSKPPGKFRPRAPPAPQRSPPRRRRSPSPEHSIARAVARRWCWSVNGRQHKTGGPPRCSAPPDPLDLMLRPGATLTLMGDQPRRPGFVRVAAAAPTDLAFDRWPLQCGPFRPARSGTNLQGCRSYRPGRPLWQTAIRKVSETFRKGPEGPPNEPWAAAAFNPEM